MIKITKILDKIKKEEPPEEKPQPPVRLAAKEKLKTAPISRPAFEAKEKEAERKLKEKAMRLEEEKAQLEAALRAKQKKVHAEKAIRGKPLAAAKEVISAVKPGAAKDEAEKQAAAFYQTSLETVRKNFETFEEKRRINLKDFSDLATKCIELYKEEPYAILQRAGESMPYVQLLNNPLNTTIYSIAIGTGLNYDDARLHELAVTALLHDIGLVAILKSVKGLLEYPKVYKKSQKASIYKQIDEGVFDELRKLGLNEHIVTAISQSQERYDGSGYPSQLRGDEISEFARIIAVADSLEAMSHPRPYQKIKSFHESLKEFTMRRKGEYDARVTKALITKIGIYPVGTMVELDTGEVARVVKTNEKYPLCPVVCIEAQLADGEMALKEPYCLDLSEHPSVYIKREIVGDVSKAGLEEKPQVEAKTALGKLAAYPRLREFLEDITHEKVVVPATVIILIIVALLLLMKI